MPVLAKHDPLAVLPVTSEVEIDLARARFELIVETSRGRLALTSETRSRLEAVSASLLAKDAAGALAGASSSTVDWTMEGGATVTLTSADIHDLINEALVLIGEKTQRAYSYAKLLKTRFRADQLVSQRDLSEENWL